MKAKCMEYIEKSYSEIREMNREGIAFTTGQNIIFGDCIKQRYDSETCVAERNICAIPPYFEFFTPDRPTRIVFSGKGLFSKASVRGSFLELQKHISESGYSSYDLS